MGQIESEPVESQKVRSDLLKWKIILVASLGAIGFGFSSKVPAIRYTDLVLCCIPLLCAYVDVLCRHLSLRIKVIGRFRNVRGAETGEGQDPRYYRDYESFVEAVGKKGVFSLESTAVFLSSAIFCLSLAYLPIALTSIENAPQLPNGEIIMSSGILGFALIVIIEVVYRLFLRKVKRSSVPGCQEDAEQTDGH